MVFGFDFVFVGVPLTPPTNLATFQKDTQFTCCFAVGVLYTFLGWVEKASRTHLGGCYVSTHSHILLPFFRLPCFSHEHPLGVRHMLTEQRPGQRPWVSEGQRVSGGGPSLESQVAMCHSPNPFRSAGTEAQFESWLSSNPPTAAKLDFGASRVSH